MSLKPSEFDKLRRELKALQAMRQSDGWALLQPVLDGAFTEHEEALTRPGNPLRDEHVQAYLLAKRLRSWLDDQIAQREAAIDGHAQKMTGEADFD